MVTFKERLVNVGQVLNLSINPFAKGKIESSLKSPILKSTSEFVANNPYTTAALITGASNIIKKGIVSTFSALSTKTKVLTVGLGVTTAPAILGNPNAVSYLVEGASAITPESIASTSFQAGQLTQNPSVEGFKNFLVENKATLAIGGTIAALVVGKKIAPTISNVSNIIATNKNTKAINEDIKLMKEEGKKITMDAGVPISALPTVIPTGKAENIPSTVPVPIEPTTSPITTTGKVSKKASKRRKSRCSPKSINRASVNLRLNVKSIKSGVCVC